MALSLARTAVLAAVFVGSCVCDIVTVSSHAGPIVGRRNDVNEAYSFLGIPFAEPPTAERRWRRPEPKAPWTKPYEAFEFKADCAQRPNGFAPSSSEDCLFLQVWTPNVNASLPVQVWHYGGSFLNGSTTYPMYNGAKIAHDNNVVVVSMNYRMGVFGFLGHESLRSRNADGSTGNYGLQDQRLALHWVKTNIAAFGGNASAITAFGESAGAASVALHLLMPQSAGLVDRAILQSGGPSFWARKKLSGAEIDFGLVAAAANCGVFQPEESLACMLTKSTEELLEAAKGIMQWAPVIDGVDLPEDPIDMMLRGDFANKVPVLLGSNKDEGTAFATVLPMNVSYEVVQATLGLLLGFDKLLALNVLYPSFTYASPWWCAADVLGDWAFTCPTRQMAQAVRALPQPVYRYYFTRNNTKSPAPGSSLRDGPTCIGTCHGIEIPYIFQAYQYLDYQPVDERLSREASKAWTSFAATSNPNDPALSEVWPRFDDDERYLEFNVQLRVKERLKSSKCDLFDGVTPPMGSLSEKIAQAYQSAMMTQQAAFEV